MSKISRLKRLEEAMQAKQLQKMQEAQQAENQKKIEAHLRHPGHKKPVSRRDMLSIGVVGSMTYMLGPSIATILGSLSEEAYAQATGECPAPAPAGQGPAPFIALHLEGGYQPLSAATPRMTNGNRLANYSRLGLGQNPTFVNNAFSNRAELFDNGANQGFLRGLQAGAQASTLAAAALVTIPVRDNGDDGGIRANMMGLVSRAGRAGSKLNFLRRNGSENNGSNSNSIFGINTSVRPLNVGSVNSILGAVQPTGALSRLTLAQQVRMSQAIQNLNAQQAANIAGLNGGKELAKLAECATGQNLKNLQGGGAALNPRDIANMSNVWGNFAVTNNGDSVGEQYNNDAHSAAVVNVLNGNAAGASIQIGGYDIHGGGDVPRNRQEAGAFSAGQLVGRMLESARLLNTKVFIHITTNGSVVCVGGQPNSSFNDDDNAGNCFGATHFIAYNPAGPIAPIGNTPAQIGGLNANGNIDTSVFTTNQDDAGAAAFYNYCILSGDEALFDRTLAGIKTYSAAQKQIMRKIG